VQKKSVSLSLDWIEGTFPQNVKVAFPDEFSKDYHECRPLNGYTEGSKFTDGRVLLTSLSRPDMGTHVIWSGGTLPDCPIPALGLVHWLSRAGFRFSRLDMAIDVRGWMLKPRHATQHIVAKDIITRARKCPRNDDPMFGGYTQYVGKRTSSLFLRIYDKAAQMGEKSDWTRLELVSSGKRANVAGAAIIRGEDYRGMVSGFVRFPKWKKWNQIMAVDAVSIPSPKKLPSTELWLLNQAAPALAKILSDKPDNTFLNVFLDAVFTRRDEIALLRSIPTQSLDTGENEA
jgi:hypothetical protein